MKLKILRFWILIFACRVDSQTTTAPPQTTTPKDVYVANSCICVPKGACEDNSDGAGKLDLRIMTSGGDPNPITGSNNATLAPASAGVPTMVANQTSCDDPLELCCQNYYTCGRVYPPVANSPSHEASQGQVPYGSFPWMAAIINSDTSTYICGGSLISNGVVITAAHKIAGVSGNLEALLGEWDASKTAEPLPTLNVAVKKIVIHPNFNPRNLRFNLALLFLETPVPLGENPVITNICLPSRPLVNMTRRCWVSGWGKSDFSTASKLQEILKAVDVPLVDSEACQTLLRATRLGSNFKLDTTSFICAGGEYAKDACVGDGGSPLSCSIGGINFLAGVVSWGIGCGLKDVPGVYANIHGMLDWIQQTIKANTQTVSNVVSTPSVVTTASATTTTTKAPVTTSAPATTSTPVTTTTKASSVATTKVSSSNSTMSSAINTTIAQATTKSAGVNSVVNSTTTKVPTPAGSGFSKSNLPLVVNSTTTTKKIDIGPMKDATTSSNGIKTVQARKDETISDPNTLKFARKNVKNSASITTEVKIPATTTSAPETTTSSLAEALITTKKLSTTTQAPPATNPPTTKSILATTMKNLKAEESTITKKSNVTTVRTTKKSVKSSG